jgi:hypothetical protein
MAPVLIWMMKTIWVPATDKLGIIFANPLGVVRGDQWQMGPSRHYFYYFHSQQMQSTTRTRIHEGKTQSGKMMPIKSRLLKNNGDGVAPSFRT